MLVNVIFMVLEGRLRALDIVVGNMSLLLEPFLQMDSVLSTSLLPKTTYSCWKPACGWYWHRWLGRVAFSDLLVQIIPDGRNNKLGQWFDIKR